MPVNTLQKRFRISPTAVFLFGNIYPLALFNKDLGSLQQVLLSGNICPFHIKTWDLSNYSLTLWQHLPVSTFLFTERLHLSQWNDTFWQSVTFTLSLEQKDVTSENKLAKRDVKRSHFLRKTSTAFPNRLTLFENRGADRIRIDRKTRVGANKTSATATSRPY